MPATIAERHGSGAEWTDKDEARFQRDVERLKVYQLLMDPASHAAPGEVEKAEEQAPILLVASPASQA